MRYRMRIVALLGVLAPGIARGQSPATADLAAADALFLEAKQLVAGGRVADACPRFEASMAVMPQLGVQLNLADCYERVGRTASAWVAFGQAAALARRAADPRERFARQRQDALVPRLYRLRITVSDRPPDGLTVTRDGVRVEPSAYGADVPVDPGSHAVEAAAPGRTSWSTHVVASADDPQVAIAVPALTRSPVPSSTVRLSAETGRRVTPAAWIAGGVAATAFGLGTAMGIAARSLLQESRAGCSPSNICTDSAYALVDRSRRDGNLSTAAFALAGAAVVTGVVVYLGSPRERDRPVTLVPAIAARAAGAAVTGVF